MSKTRVWSRYRCNRSECAGEYPRLMKYTNDLSCRLCGYPRETISHLLDSCSGTRAFCEEHRLSTATLVDESPSSLLKIAQFDGWIRSNLHFNSQPPANRIQPTLTHLEDRRKRSHDDDAHDSRPTKRNRLIIQDQSLSGTVRHTKVRRLR